MLCSLCYKVLFILPRLTSHYATARVKLAKHRVEEPQVQPALTFCLTKRKKVTIYLKVGIIPYNLISTLPTVFENHRKCLIQDCERSELRLHFEWTKIDKNAKNGQFSEFLKT